MRIIQLRRGFATNSSSTHAIIIAGTFSGSGAPFGQEYGWDYFLLDNEKDKLKYFGQQLKYIYAAKYMPDIPDDAEWGTRSKYQSIADNKACLELEELLGVEVNPDGHIDHQSNMHIPRNPDGTVNYEFLLEFVRAVAKDDNLHIRGGNDNSDYEDTGVINELTNGILRGYRTPFASNSIIRKSNGVWVAFNTDTGEKVHLDLRENSVTAPVKLYRPEFPELVDLKITDFCNKGCNFCYQDSSPEGQHAPTSRIFNWMQTCKDAGVLELAIGGGEPTKHPDFLDILKEANRHFISVAFSTRDLDWLRDVEYARKVAELVRAVGFSVSSKQDMQKIKKSWAAAFYSMQSYVAPHTGEISEHERLAIPREPRLVYHIIPELLGKRRMTAILREADYSATLLFLGLKTSGRGKSVNVQKGMDALREFLDGKDWIGFNVSVDTSFANEQGDLLNDYGIDNRTYYVQEGRFSLYYDAVTNQYGPSSYHVEHLKDATPAFERGRGGASRSAMPVQEMFDNVWPLKV